VDAALDRPALVREALGGLATPAHQIIPAGIFGYTLDQPVRQLDRAWARDQLRAAGIGNGRTVRLDFPRGRYRGIERVAEAVAGQLDTIGLKVTVQGRDSEEFLNSPDPGAHLWLIGWLSTRDAGISYDYLVHTPKGGLGAFNWMGYSNPEVDALLDTFRSRGTPEEHARLLRSVGEHLADDVPAVGLYQTVDLYAAVREIDFDPRPDRRVLGVDLDWAPH
jgi:peptide/nickel transport system substrate-binding protein